ncbi:hypothetical protein ABKN59_001155 [Abortiporus biennis]
MIQLNLALLLTAMVLSLLPGTYAGPACTRRLAGRSDCTTECGKKWGWPGRTMGTDPWGQVMTVTVTDYNLGTVLQKQCRLRSNASTTSTTASSSSSTIISPSVPVANAASVVSFASDPTTAIVASSTPSVSSTSVSSSTSSSSAHTESTTSSSSSHKANTFAAPHTSSRFVTSTRSTVTSPSSVAAETHSSSSSAARPTTTAPPPAPSSSATTSAKAQTTKAAAASPAAQSSGSGSTSSSDISAYLSAHNSVRAQHGATALTWSDNLASKAQQWANGCVFQHSGGSLGPFGENLAAGTGSSYDIAAAVKSWTDEASQYDPNNPQPSHFTQVVWKGTTQVGCAVQSCDGIFDPSFGKAKFFVCEYSPQGNIIGEFAQNVQA